CVFAFAEVGACQQASARAPAVCAGSPLAIEDNIGETIFHGKRSVRSVAGITQILDTVGNSVGWLYVDDGGLNSALLKSMDSPAVFKTFGRPGNGAKWVGPFFVRNGVPMGFKVQACKI